MRKTLYQALPMRGVEAFKYGYEETPNWFCKCRPTTQIGGYPQFGDYVVLERHGEIAIYSEKEFWTRYCIEEEITDEDN